MERTNFKALAYGRIYVDANMLEQGIYECSIPFIYSKDETIESLLSRAARIKDMVGTSFVGESYFDNLKECQLVDIEINRLNQ